MTATLIVAGVGITAVAEVTAVRVDHDDPFEILRQHTASDTTNFVVEASGKSNAYFANREVVLDVTRDEAMPLLRRTFSKDAGWTINKTLDDYLVAKRGEQTVYLFPDVHEPTIMEHRSLNVIQVLGLKLARNTFARVQH